MYTGQLAATDTLERIFERFNIDHPQDFTGHSLSVSDVVTLNRDGAETAHYVDSFGFQEVPQFLQQQLTQDFDVRQTAERLQKIHDNVMQADPNKTMGIAAYNVALKRLDRLNAEIPDNQPQMKALISHAAESADLSTLKERMTAAMQEVSPIMATEMSDEQNYNMIDGIPNNHPSVSELEEKAQAGEPISLYDLANAIKAERSGADRGSGEKPSIREQLKAGVEQSRREQPEPERKRDKSPEMEV